MPLEISGTLHKTFTTVPVTDRFNKREFVLELSGRHPQLVLFQLTGKRCADLDAFRVGEKLRVEFSLRGREWTSRQGEVKYFNSLEVSKLERIEGVAEGAAAAPAEPDDSDEPPF